MKLTSTYSRAAALTAALLTVVVAPRLEAAESLLIEPRVGVGRVKAGMTTNDVVRALGPPNAMIGPGPAKILQYPNLGLEVRFDPRRQRVGAVFCGSVIKTDPSVTACKARTKEGIGTGSSRSEVIKVFGEPSKTSTMPDGSESLVYKEKGLDFGVSDGKVHSLMVIFESKP